MGNVPAATLLKKAMDNVAVYLRKRFFLFLLEKGKEEVNVTFVGRN